jgi:hypothetical protein
MTGADLEGLTNDAALLAVRRHRDPLTINHPEVFISMEDFRRAFESMSKSNPRFDRLDSILVESVTQFAEPTGKAVARNGKVGTRIAHPSHRDYRVCGMPERSDHYCCK